MVGTRAGGAVSSDLGDTPLVAVVGPTGTGKTVLAMALAEALTGEIVSVDSGQVFRGLDVGTAKPTKDEQARVPHHLIDVIEPNQQWSAKEFARAADLVIAEVRARQRTPILCGGTGLWLRALVHGIFEAPEVAPEVRRAVREELATSGAPALHAELSRVDPVAASRINPQDPQRIGRALEVYRQAGVPISLLQASHGFREERYSLVAVAVRWPRDELARRIEDRTRSMYRGGLVEEVERCMARGIPAEAPGLSIIGYRDAVRYVSGQVRQEEAIESTIVATRQYAKRQRSWFQSVPEVEWVERTETCPRVLARLRARSRAL